LCQRTKLGRSRRRQPSCTLPESRGTCSCASRRNETWEAWLAPSHVSEARPTRLIDSCITQLKAQGSSRTCNESEEEEEEDGTMVACSASERSMGRQVRYLKPDPRHATPWGAHRPACRRALFVDAQRFSHLRLLYLAARTNAGVHSGATSSQAPRTRSSAALANRSCRGAQMLLFGSAQNVLLGAKYKKSISLNERSMLTSSIGW